MSEQMQMRKWKKEGRVGDLGTKVKRKVSGRMGMSRRHKLSRDEICMVCHLVAEDSVSSGWRFFA